MRERVTILLNLITEMTSHYLCHILLGRSKSLGSTHTERKEITQRYKYQEVGLLGSISQAAYDILQPQFPPPPSSWQHLCKFLKTHLNYRDFSSSVRIFLTNPPQSWWLLSFHSYLASNTISQSFVHIALSPPPVLWAQHCNFFFSISSLAIQRSTR